MRTSDTITALAGALSSAQGEYPKIAKDQEADIAKYKYKYADLADIFGKVLPVLSKHGLAIIQPTSFSDNVLMVVTRLIHKTGEWVESDYPVCSIQGDHQRMGSALTYSRRYALCALIGIAPGGEDDDGANAEKLSQIQKGKQDGLGMVGDVRSGGGVNMSRRNGASDPRGAFHEVEPPAPPAEELCKAKIDVGALLAEWKKVAAKARNGDDLLRAWDVTVQPHYDGLSDTYRKAADIIYREREGQLPG